MNMGSWRGCGEGCGRGTWRGGEEWYVSLAERARLETLCGNGRIPSLDYQQVNCLYAAPSEKSDNCPTDKTTGRGSKARSE